MSQTNYSLKLFGWTGLAIFLALQGCATIQRNVDSQLDSNAKVRIQICLPSKRIYFKALVLEQLENHPLFTKYSQQQLQLAPKAIRRVYNSDDPSTIHTYGISFGEVLIRDGQFSDGAGFVPLRDSTISDQPVYEKGYGYPLRNYVAMHVRLPDSEKGTEGRGTYWFTLPKSIPSDRFTDWFSPISMEPDGERLPIWWKLTHGGNLVIYPVPANPPKMRVSLEIRREEHNDPTTDTLPALTTARMKYRTATSGQQFVYEFVPAASEAIPACN